MPHVHTVQVYYEDTDFSGVVYHANYLKFFERAREHLLGPAELVRLYQDLGVGFVVYKAELTFREAAVFGEALEVRTTARIESEYRVVFYQQVWRAGGRMPLVEGIVQLVWVDRDRQLVPLPPAMIAALGAAGA